MNATLPDVGTLLAVADAIQPTAHHHFRWVMSTTTRDALRDALHSDGLMWIGEHDERLVGLAIREDDTIAGLYLEWI